MSTAIEPSGVYRNGARVWTPQWRHVCHQHIGACEIRREETMVRVAGEAALRRGELAALRVSGIDLDRREVEVMRTLVRDTTRRLVEKQPKGGESRIVRLANGLASFVAEYLHAERLTGDALVFCGHRGRSSYLKPEMVRTTVVGKMVRARIVDPASPAKARFKLHDLRKAAATLVREAGAALDVNQGALGPHRTFLSPNATTSAIPHTLPRAKMTTLPAPRRCRGVAWW